MITPNFTNDAFSCSYSKEILPASVFKSWLTILELDPDGETGTEAWGGASYLWALARYWMQLNMVSWLHATDKKPMIENVAVSRVHMLFGGKGRL